MKENKQTLPKDFFELIRTHNKPIFVDFWAEWCSPCLVLAPRIQELAKQWSGKALILKINIDEKPHIAQKLNIRSIPTMILFKDGKPVWRETGSLGVDHIKAGVEPHLIIE